MSLAPELHPNSGARASEGLSELAVVAQYLGTAGNENGLAYSEPSLAEERSSTQSAQLKRV